MKVDTFGGTVHVEWDPDAAVTPLGHLAFFAEYLKVSGRFDALVADCPLVYTSPNAPSKRDVLGTVLLSVLAGQSRYAHITALRGDGVNPALLGMGKIASEDSVRRGLERIGAEAGTSWLQGHLDDTVRPLLSEPWVLDCDTTIKPLYGRQEGAVVSYNPKKPGRPSHACHAFLMAGTRLVLDVEVAPGNHHRSNRAAPSLWALLDRLGRDRWPCLVRGDKDWGSEGNMASCEAAGLDYLFKLRLTKGARRLAERQMARDEWEDDRPPLDCRGSKARCCIWSGRRSAGSWPRGRVACADGGFRALGRLAGGLLRGPGGVAEDVSGLAPPVRSDRRQAARQARRFRGDRGGISPDASCRCSRRPPSRPCSRQGARRSRDAAVAAPDPRT
ncbi:MAG: transposase, partial [Defluviicoccus sp.]|nr:transposase [Defluviicoccus sp.]